MESELVTVETPAEPTPAILLQAREKRAQWLMMAYAITGLGFMLLPGTFLGVWNLISISGRHGPAVSPAWIQAHGHAQIFGWIGTFILGIGFYSIPKMLGKKAQSATRGWIAWALWTCGVSLRWASGFYQFYWRISLPVSAFLELAAFLIFFNSVRNHRPEASTRSNGRMPVWVVSVLVGTAGFAVALLMNAFVAAYLSLRGASPAFPAGVESRFLMLVEYAFIVPTIWGFSARWLPVFLGLRPVSARTLGYALLLSVSGVVLAALGLWRVAPWFVAIAALASVDALHLFGKAERPAKTIGVHASFPVFVRVAYVWLVIATSLGIFAPYLDHANGWVGGSRHALTVGFIAGMVFAIGQRVLPAFAGMRVLFSSKLMLAGLLLLNAGCVLRVSGQILAYEGYWSPAWKALPWSAICELAAVTIFAANLLLTFRQAPAHEMKAANAA